MNNDLVHVVARNWSLIRYTCVTLQHRQMIRQGACKVSLTQNITLFSSPPRCRSCINFSVIVSSAMKCFRMGEVDTDRET